MTYITKLLPEASLDIKESVTWYNQQKEGLGARFYEVLKSKFNFIEMNPRYYQVSYRDLRSASLKKFPYQIHHRIAEDQKTVIVFAVTHTSRDPQTWRSRV